MEHRFTGTPLVLGPSEVSSYNSQIDSFTPRNDKMISTLLKNGVTGMFLFYLRKDLEGVGSGVVLPPGLSQEDTKMFELEFSEMFERYARLANRGT